MGISPRLAARSVLAHRLCWSWSRRALVAIGATATSASALQPPWVQSTVTIHQAPHVICRANGGSLSANHEADQDLGFTMTYPDGVHQGDTFNIKIRPDVSLYPRTDSSTGIAATINYIYNQMSSYQLPSGLAINSVTLRSDRRQRRGEPRRRLLRRPGERPAQRSRTAQGDTADRRLRPARRACPRPQLLPIPGVAPNAFWNTSTNRVYTTLLGQLDRHHAVQGRFGAARPDRHGQRHRDRAPDHRLASASSAVSCPAPSRVTTPARSPATSRRRTPTAPSRVPPQPRRSSRPTA